jgi:hypothetical protein
VCYTNTSYAQFFVVVIARFIATESPRLDLFMAPGPDLTFHVRAGSVLEPATSPSAFGVGAACWQAFNPETYSSSGPTIDGRTKPDIIGLSSVSSGTPDEWAGTFTRCETTGFRGTSAATAHVSGAAALVLAANPAFGPSDIQTFIQGRADDLGPLGMDNDSGAGRLKLGTLPLGATPGVTPTRTATPDVGPDPPSPTPTRPAVATAQPRSAGGRGLTLQSDSSGVRLTWQGGQGQSGYAVYRLGASPASISTSANLPASATSVFDPFVTVMGGPICYLVVATGVNPEVRSDLLCVHVNTRSPVGAPQHAAIRLDESDLATLSWAAPVGGGEVAYGVLPLLPDGELVALPPSAKSVTLPTKGPTCYLVLVATAAGVGNADVLCGIPSVATIGA